MFPYLLSIALPLCFFLHQSTLTLAINSPGLYSQQLDHVAVNCGSSGNSTAEDTRQWTGDDRANYVTSLHGSKSKLISSKATDQPLPYYPIPYTTARLSRWPFFYTFRVTPGQKLIRLHFYPASYRGGFKRSKALFTVKAGPYTLLSNFSASLTADALSLQCLVKEYCVDVEEDQPLIITFIPSRSGNSDEMYAFVNGIEIISIPAALYRTREGTLAAQIVGKSDRFTVDESFALEKVHRLNVGGSSISSAEDTPMFRDWYEDSNYLLEKSSVKPVTTTIRIKYTSIPPYTAPQKVYQTSWSMVPDKQANKTEFNFTWRLPVDLGFRYLLRLHFCELEYEIKESGWMEFSIFVNEQVVEAKGDLIKWSGGNGVAMYKDYVVMMEGDRIEGKRDLLIVLRRHNHGRVEPLDATLKGIEVFKLSNPDKNLAGVNPVLLSRASTSPKPKKLVFASGGNAIATGVVILLTVLNIIVYQLRSLGENSAGRNLSLSTSEGLCRRFSLAELTLATNNFDDELVIGSGGFGKVYKALINDGATTVALKRCKLKSQGAKEFWTEIEMLSKLRHRHLVSLLGYCDESNEMILVYEFMEHGTLADHLYKTKTSGDGIFGHMSWEQRLNICIGAARGLDYLHTDSLPKGRPTMADVVVRLEYALASERAVDEQFGENAQRDGSLPRGDAPSSSTSALYSKNIQGQFRSKGNGRKVFVRTTKFLAKGAHIKLKKRKVYDSNGEQSLSAVSSTRSILQWKKVTLQFRRFSVGGKIPRNFSSSATVGSEIPRNFSSSAASGGNEAYPGGQILPDSNLRIFRFLELKTATRNFRVDMVLGEGGFGKVYKGWLEEKVTSKSGSGSVVAIKKLDYESMQGFDEWQSEVHFLGRLSHPNLVKLLGYCWEDNELLLVYEFMQKGSLENHLFGRGAAVQPLPWDLRLKILIGAAQGLAFLHTSEKQVIYRDFKASNILLDGCYNAKISDFGLAKLGPSASKSHITTRVMGTSGYASPEYVATGHFYVKSDVYGFGVKEVEACNGLPLQGKYPSKAALQIAQLALRKLKHVMDSQLQGKYPSKAALQIAQLALKCIEPEQKTRPSMKVVVETLQHLVENDEKLKEPSGNCNEFCCSSGAMFLEEKNAKQGIKEDKLDQLIDPSLRDQISENCLKVFAEVANKCLDSLPKVRPTMADVVVRLEHAAALASERAVDEQFGENAQRDDSLPRGDAPSSSTKFLAKGAHIKLARQRYLREVMLLPPPRSKVNVSKVFQRTAKFLAKGAHIKLKKRKVYDSNGEQSLSAVSSTRSILQWKNVTLQFRRFSVGGKISRNFSSFVTVGSKILRNFSSSAASGGNEAYPGGQILPNSNLRIFSFKELKTATRNFRVNTMLGEGGFGKVYKGLLKEKATSKNGRGSAVAIKKLDTESMQGFDEWQSEVHFLGRLSHPNLVKLLGYCWEDNELLLVYEFMQKGSLLNHLFGRGAAIRPLPWDIRLKILIGAAQGLAFLHTSEKQVIYRDFKASNILLDGCYNAKISDFGLAKLGPSASKSHITTRVMGTSGYAAPEYVATGHLYVKGDVYGFGVVLIEMLTGLRVIDPNRPGGRINLVDWIKPYLSDGWKLKQVMDSQLQGKYPSKAALQIAQLALKCIELEQETRPSMKAVVETLQHLVATDEKPEEPRVHPRNHTTSSP
ncbi:hypothetical protein RHGRI_013274 [Rhododendron griersonianum]|uniref:non-specific serine/threonine protein kinase n=1 Tax=Rhododendron griersonianum TaxID=479676 RepID=A0AAV6K561_9ERIC|nr:hypothetical protein RHGRI_013274 [Rhododendron griersonianum]